MAQLHSLPAGYTITVTAAAKAAGIRQVEDNSINTAVMPGFSHTFGPYLVPRSFLVDDGASVTVDAYTASFGNLLIANAGAPVDAVQATIGVNPTGDDNALTYTARTYGAAGNAITITYVDPGANSQSLAVSVAYTSITVSLATNGGGTITSTAAQVKAAIEANVEANQLVTVAIDASDSGTGDDGSGVVTAIAKTALESGEGTGIGVVLPGGLCVDTANADLYRNDGTQAAPVWVQVGDAA